MPKEQKLNILLLEGVAIFFVMLVHAGTPNYIYAFFSYGLSSLAFARGYQWKDRGFKELIKSRVLLVQAYYVAGFINTLIYLILAPQNVLQYPKYVYITNYLIGRMDKLDQVAINAVPLWFFLMLFLSEVMYYFVNKSSFLLAASVLLAIIFRIIPHEPFIFKIDSAIVALLFFWLGKIWRKYELEVRPLDFALSILALILISQTNGDISWNNQWFGKSGFIALLGEIMAVFVVIYLSEMVKAISLDKFFYKLAFNALFVIGYHMLLGSLLYVILNLFGIVISDVMSLLNKIWYIYFAFDLLIVYLAIRYIPAKVKSLLIGDFRRVLK
ncbi:hypothetical protein [Fervidobacterium nodosum]|uniref:Acyltransferase 3 domain-containing protein n=1 Tax=Fervidobacterium nodosum (strain ATCC 35602 / DSM 5306 / Rt17-B1) TaxID=381764 RepID=A7HN18_FERNB|nr:hypothetical protein [Fervidobacterium nodosum]ABS61301.1 hypothetical protein Fnod_1458 [Fervidobacterium nodosum Rt17-B1]